jgi:hypothetical protein
MVAVVNIIVLRLGLREGDTDFSAGLAVALDMGDSRGTGIHNGVIWPNQCGKTA